MYNNKKILALIPARGGSKGVKKKNIRDLCGKPLIAWTIEAAQRSKYIDRLILSSEDEAIIRIARNFGCEVPFVRPSSLAQDETPSIDVVIHALENLKEKYDYLLLLQATSPLRESKDIDECIEFFFENNAESCTSVRIVKEPPFRMYFLDEKNILTSIMSNPNYTRRQDMPNTYITNGAIYLTSIDFLIEYRIFIDEKTLAYIMSPEKSYDIDTEDDFEVCKTIMETR